MMITQDGKGERAEAGSVEQYRAGFEAWAEKPIFLVSAHWDHEGSSPIKAFADKADADALSARCHEYHQTKPRCPEIGSTPENDAEWAAWQVESDKWEKSHPAGEGKTTCDSFFVTEIPLASKREASTEPSEAEREFAAVQECVAAMGYDPANLLGAMYAISEKLAGAGALPDEATAELRDPYLILQEMIDVADAEPECVTEAMWKLIVDAKAVIANAETNSDEAKDAARLNAFIDWFIRGGARHEIHELAHIAPTTREHVLASLDAAIAQSKVGKPT